MYFVIHLHKFKNMPVQPKAFPTKKRTVTKTSPKPKKVKK